MLYRIYPDRDTFLTNFQLQNVQRTGSNFGNSEILHLFKQAGVSGAVGVAASSSLARILTRFDLSAFQALTGSSAVPADGITYVLRMSDAQHDRTLPSSFDVEVQAVAQDWDEGRGRDVDRFADRGVANWDKAKSNVLWTTPGASGSGPIATQHFDSGHENLEVDVTSIVQLWMSGTLANNGFLVRVSSSQEQDGLDYYTKMFHSRETFFKDKRPYLEARWDRSTRDDRNNFYWGVSGTLFLYHGVRGAEQDIPGVGTGQLGVRVVDASGTVAVLTASHAGYPGTYAVTFTVPSGNFSGSLFRDIWFNLATTASWYMTGSFGIADSLSNQVRPASRYFVSVVNLKSEYEVEEAPRLSLFVRPHDYNPARVLTASLDSHGAVITKGYFRVVNDRTDEVVVPFGTGSLEYTRMAYDERGNYFNIWMSSLSPGNVYRLSFLFDVDGQRQYVDQGFKFRVV